MANEILKLLNQEIIETRKLATEAKRTADAAWAGVDRLTELVIITRNEMQLRTRPWWKKLFGIE